MIIRYLSIFVIIIATFGCATPVVKKNASEYLLTTDQNIQTLLNKIKTQMESYKYQVSSLDSAAGILTFEPRIFSYGSESQKTQGKQMVYIRAEGGSVKIRIDYLCDYSGQNFEDCLDTDHELKKKVSRLEPALLKIIKPVLLKNAAQM